MNAFQIRNIEVQAAFIIFPGILGNIFNIWVYSRGITEKRSLLDSRHCNYTMTQQITYCSISRRPTSVDVVGMHQDALYILLSTCRTCSTEPIMNYHAPAIAAQEFPRPHIYLLCALEIFIRPSKRRNMICIWIVQHLAEHPAPPRREHYLDSSQGIYRILDDYPNWQRLQYLRAIAQNVTF